ncbi:PAS domain-containing protein [Croceibacterium selenioxidans]|uniref:PAS domain-containing protein n=1 Tax=Croceibacterium selenioxidans TaxID=2838833 RepID=UPI00308420DC
MNATSIQLRAAEKQPPQIDPEEEERLRILRAYGLDSLQDDPELSAIATFAAKLCEAPVALVSLVEEERQRFLAREGLDQRDTPRDVSFCTHAMMHGGLMQVRDPRSDPRFARNPYVIGEPFVRFYAGQPLLSEEGIALGALCIIDTHERPDGLTEMQRDGLSILAQAVMRRLRSRRHSIAARREHAERETYLRTLADSIPAIAWSADPAGNFDYFNQRMVEFTGEPEDTNGGSFHPEDWKRASAAWRHSLATGETYEIEHRLRRHDGEYRWMISRAVPVRDADGKIVRWFGTAVDIHDLYAASESRDLLAKELSHRIKNIFAVVSGLISLSVRNRPDVKGFGDELIGTIRALGRAHDYVRPAQGKRSGTLNGMLKDLFGPYRKESCPRISIHGDDLAIAPRSATPLALVFHELATNSAKYGALSSEEGTVELTVTDQGETMLLRWVERGGPPPKAKVKEGFGSRLVEMSVTGQLDGWWERRFEPAGLVCDLTVSRAAISR